MHPLAAIPLAAKHIAVVASMSCLSGLQFENNTNNQEKAHEMYLLYQQMRQKVGRLAAALLQQDRASLPQGPSGFAPADR